ncbi:MAG: hypothetical protein KM310_10385 [Clostridiales bacterium]|nr:hypothetical protein [Clostridiales bacterium]
MSHVSAYTTEIVFQTVAKGGRLEEDPAWEILQQAVQAVAEAHGGHINQTVRDIFGRPTACDIAVHVPHLKGGLGMSIDRRTGELLFLYDDYGRVAEFQALKDEVVQNFSALAVAKALQALHYQVDVEETGLGGERRVLVRGVLA